MSSIIRFQPFGDMVTLRDAMDRLFEDSFVRSRGWLIPSGAAMDLAMDVYETENDVVVTASIPGVKAEELDITIIGDVLTIKGQTQAETKEEMANYHRQERRFGAFARSIALPVQVQSEKAAAKLKDGVLTLTLPKAEELKPKTIKVKTESK